MMEPTLEQVNAEIWSGPSYPVTKDDFVRFAYNATLKLVREMNRDGKVVENGTGNKI